MRKPAAAAWAAPLVCLGVFLWFYFPILGRMGVETSSVARLSWTLMHEVLLHGRRPELLFPLIDTHGPGDVYASVPFIVLFGHTPAAMFWRNGAFACLALIAAYLTGWAMFRDRWAAFFTALILATSPGFILYSMLGVTTAVSVTALATVGVYFLLRYADEREARLAYLGFASLGLALICRTETAAYLLGLLAFAGLYRRPAASLLPREPGARRRFSRRCLAAFCAAAAPLAAACVFHFRAFFAYWSAHAITRTDLGGTLDFGANLPIRVRQLALLLADRDGLKFFVAQPELYAASSRWFLAAAAAVAGVAILLRALGRGSPPRRRWALPWVVGAVYLLASSFSPSFLRVMHLFPLLPLISLAACTVIVLASRPKLKAAVLASFFVFCGLRLRAEVLFFDRFYADLSRSGVRVPNFSVEAVELTDWFARRPEITPVLFGEGGAGAGMIYFSGGRVVPVVLGASFWRSGQPERDWRGTLEDGGARFVIADDPMRIFYDGDALAALTSEASRRGGSVTVAGEIDRPDATPVFRIYRFVPKRVVHGTVPA